MIWSYQAGCFVTQTSGSIFHLLFGLSGVIVFLYRDLVDLLTRNRLLEVPSVVRILGRGGTAMQLGEGAGGKRRRCKPLQADALANNMAALEPAGCHFPAHEIHGGKWRARRETCGVSDHGHVGAISGWRFPCPAGALVG